MVPVLAAVLWPAPVKLFLVDFPELVILFVAFSREMFGQYYVSIVSKILIVLFPSFRYADVNNKPFEMHNYPYKGYLQ